MRKPYLKQFYRKNRLNFALALVATVLISLLNLVISWVFQQTLDAAAGSSPYTAGEILWMVAGILAGIVIIKALARYAEPRFIHRAMEQYKAFAFEKLTQKSIATFTRENTAAYLSVFSNDAVVIESGYLDQIFSRVFNGILMVGALVMMLVYSPILTAVAVLLSLLPMGAALLTGKQVERAEEAVSRRNEDFLTTLKDALTGFPVVKSFGAEGAMTGLFQQRNRGLEQQKCSKRSLVKSLSILGAVASVTTQFGTMIAGLFLLAAGYDLTPGVILIFADLVGNVIRPINDLPEQLARRKAALGLVDKLAAALEQNLRDEGEDIPARLERGITVENLTFGYTPEAPVLQDISFCFEAGKRYALVGASGSGKSTLLDLLMAAHGDYQGAIRYDGREVRAVSSRSLYDLVSRIGQQVFLFNNTIRDNITLFQQFPQSEIDRATGLSGLDRLLAQKGADALCGENGCLLSGGEKQRVSIARALLRRSPVLLADEATAALDRETAGQVTDAILSLPGLTCILVTHALEARQLCQFDGILLLKNGRLAEAGTFAELMAKKGDFYALYTTAQ